MRLNLVRGMETCLGDEGELSLGMMERWVLRYSLKVLLSDLFNE